MTPSCLFQADKDEWIWIPQKQVQRLGSHLTIHESLQDSLQRILTLLGPWSLSQKHTSGWWSCAEKTQHSSHYPGSLHQYFKRKIRGCHCRSLEQHCKNGAQVRQPPVSSGQPDPRFSADPKNCQHYLGIEGNPKARMPNYQRIQM